MDTNERQLHLSHLFIVMAQVNDLGATPTDPTMRIWLDLINHIATDEGLTREAVVQRTVDIAAELERTAHFGPSLN